MEDESNLIVAEAKPWPAVGRERIFVSGGTVFALFRPIASI
ncbi:MAG: hypothetical protein AB7U75_18605 [Hyphomicrobiaceae bacterium]